MRRIHLPEIMGMLLLATVMTPLLANAQYEANAGAETKDQSVQANGFFPNEVWIWEGDNITWTFVPKNEIHTVTFLKANQVRPPSPPPAGPPRSRSDLRLLLAARSTLRSRLRGRQTARHSAAPLRMMARRASPAIHRAIHPTRQLLR